MVRLAIIVCLVSRVICGEHTVQRGTYSEHVYRKLRPNMPTLQGGVNAYRQFDKPRTYSAVGLPPYDPLMVKAQYDTRTLEKMRNEAPIVYEDFIAPYTTPSIIKQKIDYEIAKSVADAKYEDSKSSDDDTLEKLKSIMHYSPPTEMTKDIMPDYASSEYSMDDDDVRSSSRSLYDNWPYFYHSPYEYETNGDALNTEKAKDKRYVMDGFDSIIPVQEIIENDVPPQPYEPPRKYYHEVTDNPIVADEPFFSFILNDYYEKNNAEDPVIFKGLDIGRDFDHETYFPEVEEARRSRRIDNSYYTTISPVTSHYDAHNKVSQAESVTEQHNRRNHEFDTRKNGVTRGDHNNSEYANKATEYNGFKDFLDNFAQKFGSEDHKRNSNYIHETNKDKGENRKGFRRVYHKDEYMEDKEFYDNNNSSTRGVDKASSNAHIGGSEAYLRSQAAAAVGNRSHAASNAGKANNATFNNHYSGHDRSNTSDNKFNKYIDVAKQTAQSNDADYADHYRI
ncbi:unnamed protein product [Spodoptera exigua]|nr:unnamed protein product [Spodoptera exigua]